MTATGLHEARLTYSARPEAATRQGTLPGRYRWWVMAVSMAAFAGWFNESWFYLYESPIWLNHYTEYTVILAQAPGSSAVNGEA